MDRTDRRMDRKERYIRNIYGSICAAASVCAAVGVWRMAVASPGQAAMVASCVAVIALARADVVIRFGTGGKHDKKR